MRNYKKWPIILMMAIGFSGVVMAEKPKMATVDMQELFRGYHRTSSTERRLHAEHFTNRRVIGKKQKTVKKMRRKIEMIAAYLKKNNVSDEQKAEQQYEGMLIAQEMQIIQSEIDRFKKRVDEAFTQKKVENMQLMMADITEKVKIFAEENGYEYVFDQSGLNTNQMTFALYLNGAKDITSEMLKKINQ